MVPLTSKIRVVRASSGWVAIDKPAGLLSVPGKGEANQTCAASWCREAFPDARGPITVHRLDMDTSGLLLMALDPETHRALSAQFEARAVAKSYTAVVAGIVAPDSGHFDAPMRLDPDNRPRQIIDAHLGKPAVTRFQVLSRDPAAPSPRSRLALFPLTGRTHQLRLHCAHAGHPILGDPLYGDETSAPRLLLHAETLEFDDPADGTRVRCHAPAPF